MERVYIRSYYLKAAHYFFYSMSVFSLTVTVSFWRSFMIKSLMFAFFCIIYANIGLWLAYFFYKDYEKEIKGMFVLRRYAPPYVILSIFVVFGAEMLIFTSPDLGNLIFSMLFINYYYVFIVAIGAALYMLKPVRRLFEFRTKRILRNAKSIVLKYSRLPDIKDYKPGTDPIIDEILDDVWGNKDYPVPHVQRLEIEVCRNRIEEIQAKIDVAETENRNKEVIRSLKRKKSRYEKLLEQISSYRD